MRNVYISALVQYGLDKKFIEPCHKQLIIDQLLTLMQVEQYTPADSRTVCLEQILEGLTQDAAARGVCADQELFRTMLMDVLTPSPEKALSKFRALSKENPEEATEYYYRFCQDADYIRRTLVQKDIHWKVATEYGNLDIAIPFRNPHRDPGNSEKPDRWSIPIRLADESWNLQYSPTPYYTEHCTVVNSQPSPKGISKSTLQKLMDFVTIFPHYFIGFDEDLTITDGNVLTQETFLGGCFRFPIARAPIERRISFNGFEDVSAGIVKWPMSVIRLTCPDKYKLCNLAVRILLFWQNYTDKDAISLAKADGATRNTITPIARRKGKAYELDLVLRSDTATKKYPLGVCHSHALPHPIVPHNIGLIAVMGLAVLPSTLKAELVDLEKAILSGAALTGELEKHTPWVKGLMKRQTFTPDNTACILKMEVGKIFAQVLEHAGVYKRTPEGSQAFDRFVAYVNQEF